MDKVLIAIDLDEASAEKVIDSALRIVAPDKCAVLHVIEPSVELLGADPTLNGSVLMDTYEQILRGVRDRIETVCETRGLNRRQCLIRYGRVAHEIHEVLDNGNFDTLMIGSHGRNGWRSILGTHANSIVQGAPVNTWVFRIDTPSPQLKNKSQQ